MNNNFAQLRKMLRNIGRNPAVAVSSFLLGALSWNPCYAADAASFASDGVSFEVGSGNGAEMWRLGITKNWDRKWLAMGNWHLGGYWEAQIGQWSGSDTRTINDLGLTPVFRFQQTEPSKISPYVEAGVGAHVITPTMLDDSRHFGGAFQFGDLVGTGARFGEHGRYDLGLRFEHLSNGGIKKPNNGINFTQLRFVYHLD
jgi:lipid A 3-O-deacylase